MILHNLMLGAKVCIPRVGMAAFKLPSLSKKRRRPLEFPEFSWNSMKIKEELGSGTFGSLVYLVDFNVADKAPQCCCSQNRSDAFRRKLVF